MDRRTGGWGTHPSPAARQFAAGGLISTNVAFTVHTVNILLELVLPVALVLAGHPHPAASFVVMFNVTIVWMKLISYVSVNSVRCVALRGRMMGWRGPHVPPRVATTDGARRSPQYYRTLKPVARANGVGAEASLPPPPPPPPPATATDPAAKQVRYPQNVTFRNMAYFTFAPTLCYEIVFPACGLKPPVCPRLPRVAYPFPGDGARLAGPRACASALSSAACWSSSCLARSCWP